MTPLEQKLLNAVEQLAIESRERETRLTSHLVEVEKRLTASMNAYTKLLEAYNTVIKYLESSRSSTK